MRCTPNLRARPCHLIWNARGSRTTPRKRRCISTNAQQHPQPQTLSRHTVESRDGVGSEKRGLNRHSFARRVSVRLLGGTSTLGPRFRDELAPSRRPRRPVLLLCSHLSLLGPCTECTSRCRPRKRKRSNTRTSRRVSVLLLRPCASIFATLSIRHIQCVLDHAVCDGLHGFPRRQRRLLGAT